MTAAARRTAEPPLAAALALYNGGDLAGAREILDGLIASRPGDVQALHLRGLVAYRGGDLESAIAHYERAYPAKRRDPLYLNHLGLALKRYGEVEGAEKAFREALAAQPEYVDAAQNLAVLLCEGSRFSEGERMLRKILTADPRVADAHYALGDSLQRRGSSGEAIDAFRSALGAGIPSRVNVMRRLAALLAEVGRFDESAELYRELAREPGQSAFSLANLGVICMARRDTAAAEEAFEAALHAEPDHVDALVGITSVRAEQGRAAEAEAMLRDATFRIPDAAALHNALSMRLLERGAYAEGWAEYSWRHRALSSLAPIVVPAEPQAGLQRLLRDEPGRLAGRFVTLVREQGLGDELFFLRFVPALAATGARVQLVAAPQLHGLLEGQVPVERIVGAAVRVGSRGLAAYIGDLPHLLAGRGDPEPPPLPLRAPASAVAECRVTLAALPRPILAVTWRAGVDPSMLKFGFIPMRKHVEPGALGAALAAWSGSIVVVQRHPLPDEIAAFSAAFGREVTDLSALNEDLVRMTSLLDLVDAYAGVSNTNMHLRASLGKPADVLVAWPPEWRWGLAQSTTPWFPGFRLHRQARSGSWQDALAGLRSSLT